jgi:hypothetical protein
MSKIYTAWRRDLLAIHGLLDSLGDRPPEDKQLFRAEVMQVAEALNLVRRSGMLRFTKARGARARILEYLKRYVGEAISGDELEVVAGIHEYPRRIRELRVQEGYVIVTGVTREELKPDEYVLESESPNAEERERWRLANRIRRLPGSEKDRMLKLLQEMVGKPVSGDQLQYVSKGKEMRRVRELRTEQGWRVSTRLTGQPHLPVGWYLLESLDQAPQHDRSIKPGVYDSVLERDGHACRRCGWTVAKKREGAKRQYIELHHMEHHKDGGPNNRENLVTLCNICHDEAHRAKVMGFELLEWLGRKSPGE